MPNPNGAALTSLDIRPEGGSLHLKYTYADGFIFKTTCNAFSLVGDVCGPIDTTPVVLDPKTDLYEPAW